MTTFLKHWKRRKSSIETALQRHDLLKGAIELGYTMEELRTVLSEASRKVTNGEVRKFSPYNANQWCMKFHKWFVDTAEENDVAVTMEEWEDSIYLIKSSFKNRHNFAHSKGVVQNFDQQRNFQFEALQCTDKFIELLCRHAFLREEMDNTMVSIPTFGQNQKSALGIGMFVYIQLSQLSNLDDEELEGSLKKSIFRTVIRRLKTHFNAFNGKIESDYTEKEFFAWLEEVDRFVLPKYIRDQSKQSFQEQVFDIIKGCVKNTLDIKKIDFKNDESDTKNNANKRREKIKSTFDSITLGITVEEDYFKSLSNDEQNIIPDILLVHMEIMDDKEFIVKESKCFAHLGHAWNFKWVNKHLHEDNRVKGHDGILNEFGIHFKMIDDFCLWVQGFKTKLQRNSNIRKEPKPILVLELTFCPENHYNHFFNWGILKARRKLNQNFQTVITMANFDEGNISTGYDWVADRRSEVKLGIPPSIVVTCEEDCDEISDTSPRIIRLQSVDDGLPSELEQYDLDWSCVVITNDQQWASLEKFTHKRIGDFLRELGKLNKNSNSEDFIPCIISLEELEPSVQLHNMT